MGLFRFIKGTTKKIGTLFTGDEIDGIVTPRIGNTDIYELGVDVEEVPELGDEKGE